VRPVVDPEGDHRHPALVDVATPENACARAMARAAPAGRRRALGRVAPMQKWEYVTVPLLVHATKQILDNWGEEGYELVTVVQGQTAEQLVAYLKRPKP
jgi:hypothetical protein